jgi:DNA replication licensing factor MCM7
MVGRHFISRARGLRPVVPAQVSNYVVECYVRMRKTAKSDEEKDRGRTYTSARTLLGILRLSQALARLRLAEEVVIGDVDEALRLMEASKASLLDEDEKDIDADRSVASKIFRLIKSMAGIGAPKPKRRRPAQSGRGLRAAEDMDVDDEDAEGDDDEDNDELSMVDIRSRIRQAGFTEQQMNEAIADVSFRVY